MGDGAGEGRWRSEGEMEIGGKGKTNRVASTVFLLRPNDTSAALGGVEGALPAHDGLAWSTTAAAGLAPNLGNGIPVIHREGYLLLYLRIEV
jgi:hypothetical protein